MTVVDVEKSPEDVAQSILRLIETGATQEIRNLGLKYLSIAKIQELEVANQVVRGLKDSEVEEIVGLIKEDIKKDEAADLFFNPELDEVLFREGQVDLQMGKKLAGKWIATHFNPSANN